MSKPCRVCFGAGGASVCLHCLQKSTSLTFCIQLYDHAWMYLFINPAVGWSVVNKDLDYVHVTSPRCKMQRKTSLAVCHISRGFILHQLQHHIPERKLHKGQTHFLVILKEQMCHFFQLKIAPYIPTVRTDVALAHFKNIPLSIYATRSDQNTNRTTCLQNK